MKHGTADQECGASPASSDSRVLFLCYTIFQMRNATMVGIITTMLIIRRHPPPVIFLPTLLRGPSLRHSAGFTAANCICFVIPQTSPAMSIRTSRPVSIPSQRVEITALKSPCSMENGTVVEIGN